MHATAHTADPAGAPDASPTRSDPTARRLAADEAIDATEASGATDAPEAGAAERGDPSPGQPPALDRPWVLVAPLAGAVVLSAVSALVDPNPLRTGTSPSGLGAFAVLVPFFLVCVAGTVALYRDAARLRAAETGWSPRPGVYVVAGAVGLTALHAYRLGLTVGEIGMGLPTGEMGTPVGFLAGTFVVALAASSVLAGPAYLLRRRRRLGRDRGDADAGPDGTGPSSPRD